MDSAQRTSTRPPDCTIERLAAPPIARGGRDDRVEFLLQSMVGAVQADSGVALVRDPETGQVVRRAAVGLDPSGSAESGGLSPNGIASGLDRRDDAPALHRRRGDPACTHDLIDRDAVLAYCVALESERGRLGEVQLGFRRDRSVSPRESQRLQVIADHIAAVVESARHAEEVEARNRELERLNATLLEMDRIKGDFLSMVSHELRTPLTAIIGYTDLLLRGSHGGLNERQLRHQGAVKKAAHRLLSLVNDLLDVNRLESGRVELHRQALALDAVARRAVAEAEAAARQKGIELRLDLPTRSPRVEADPERLHQVLTNLLDNALKFTPEDGRVTLRLERIDGQAAVLVEDTGVGIPADQLERIWDRFHQVDSSTQRHFGGTGLGLAIVRNLVELHGGRVAVESAGAGLGSRFWFTLPLAASPDVIVREPEPGPTNVREAEAEPAPAVVREQTPVPAVVGEPTPARATAARPSQRRVVLIVDDEPDNREVIAALVTDDLGYETRGAASGDEALDAARSLPDLILLDLRMPGLSGFEVARRLKADRATTAIPILAITALADEDDQRAAREAGCVGCVTKPFTPAGLTGAIVDALDAVGAADGTRP